jgi:hypothetical protein
MEGYEGQSSADLFFLCGHLRLKNLKNAPAHGVILWTCLVLIALKPLCTQSRPPAR